MGDVNVDVTDAVQLLLLPPPPPPMLLPVSLALCSNRRQISKVFFVSFFFFIQADSRDLRFREQSFASGILHSQQSRLRQGFDADLETAMSAVFVECFKEHVSTARVTTYYYYTKMTTQALPTGTFD